MKNTLDKAAAIVDKATGKAAEIISPAIQEISKGLQATIKYLAGKIETPSELTTSIEKDIKKLAEYTPYLTETEANSPYSTMDLSNNRPFTNPITTQIEPKEYRMRAEADDHTRLHLWIILKKIETYIREKSHQNFRINTFYSEFIDELITAKRKDLPEIANHFLQKIKSIE